MNSHCIVVKVGGSLYDMPQLGPKLQRWLVDLKSPNILIVPGGGPAADVIRALDKTHDLGEEAAHWLALRVLTLNAFFLETLLPDAEIILGQPEELAQDRQRWAIVDPHAFARADDDRPGSLPHNWDVTSDSISARIAAVSRARSLYLLKSVTIAHPVDWTAPHQVRIVDRYFARILTQCVRELHVSVINLRKF